MSETLITALLGVVGGGFLLELLRRLIPPAERRLDEAKELRGELRDEVKSLRAEVKALQQTVDDWQQRYYALQREYDAMRSELDEAKRELALLRPAGSNGRRAGDGIVSKVDDYS